MKSESEVLVMRNGSGKRNKFSIKTCKSYAKYILIHNVEESDVECVKYLLYFCQ